MAVMIMRIYCESFRNQTVHKIHISAAVFCQAVYQNQNGPGIMFREPALIKYFRSIRSGEISVFICHLSSLTENIESQVLGIGRGVIELSINVVTFDFSNDDSALDQGAFDIVQVELDVQKIIDPDAVRL